KKTAVLYKDVLKECATVCLEMGQHSLFFPGGARSRSGAVEQNLKKGLIGTSIRAYIGNLRAGNPKPNIYVVPCTISYTLVLEAETLIADHLTETGKSRYIFEDDEFNRPRRVYKFLSNLISLDARTVIRFSSPIDIVGNFVDEEGNSLDCRGRRVDSSRYVFHDGEPVYDGQRDFQYTTELANSVCRAYLRDNVIHSTNLVAYTVFNMLRDQNPEIDLYRLLRTGGKGASFSVKDVCKEVERVLSAIREGKEGPQLDSSLNGRDARGILNDALKAFGAYHTRPAMVRRGGRVFHEDRNLILYYSNRLKGYDLEEELV
ncbi:MAG: hypothetical protein V1754_01200, partial [Pseudomonadota bacterium]